MWGCALSQNALKATCVALVRLTHVDAAGEHVSCLGADVLEAPGVHNVRLLEALHVVQRSVGLLISRPWRLLRRQWLA